MLEVMANRELLGPNEGVGPYGDQFWSRVALATPCRTKGGCLDANIAQQHSAEVRFSASGRSLGHKYPLLPQSTWITPGQPQPAVRAVDSPVLRPGQSGGACRTVPRITTSVAGQCLRDVITSPRWPGPAARGLLAAL